MNVSSISIVITIFIWYLLIGIFNLVYLGATKKLNNLNWLKFILESFGLVAVYFVVNAVSFIFASSISIPLFMAVNALILFASISVYARYVMKLENYQFIYYSLVFTLIFNLAWYRLLGVL